MESLTQRQREVLDFIRDQHQRHAVSPSLREIARHFGFRSMTAAADHVRALRRKGALAHEPRQARSHRLVSALESFRAATVDVPVYGSIPAGLAETREQEAIGCLSVDVRTAGGRDRSQLFALQVRGDSMTGKHIVDGDYVILDAAATPHPGDVVAAVIDGESTLKTYAEDRGKPYLRAENPKYPQLIPAESLTVQGVMVTLVRRAT